MPRINPPTLFTLISATPSPYARKVRIALLEKQLPFTLQTEVPWDSTTTVPLHNPLEKLPVLITDTGKAIYESHFILEWLESKYPSPPLLVGVEELDCVDKRLFARQVEVVADGICDALVLAFFERQREPEHQSKPWMERQMRKVDGGLKALATWVEQREGEFMIGDSFGLADIAVGCVCGYLAVRWPEHRWREMYPELKTYWEGLEQRESFRTTVPSPQTMMDKIV